MMRKLLLRLMILFLAISIPLFAGCSDSDDEEDDDIPEGDDDDWDAIPTTLDVTFVPAEINGQYVLNRGPGEPHVMRDDLRVYPTRFDQDLGPLSMIYMMTTSDNHQTDEEAPTRLTFFDSDTIFFGAFESAFRPMEDLSPHQLNAIVRTANRIQADYERDFDVLIELGDSTDNGQFNELLVEIDVLSGTYISSGVPGYARPDSGDLNIDPASGLNLGERNFGIQETDAEGNNINAFNRVDYPNSNADIPVTGLRRRDGSPVPWYAAIGNHDALNTGNFEVFEGFNFYTAEDFTSGRSPYGFIPGMANTVRFWQTNPDVPIFISNGLFGIQLNWADLFSALDAIGMIPADYIKDIDERFDLMTLVHGTLEDPSDDGVDITPDVNRAFMAHDGLIQLLHWLDHGFKDNNGDGKVNAADGGWYRVDYQEIEPGSSMPLRFLFLDTVDVPTFASGGIGPEQFAWLEAELNKAIVDKVLVVVCSHHREDEPNGMATGTEELQALLHGCPNVIMHLEGHGHANLVVAQASDDLDPARGYWEVETPSTCTFPQQSRIIEIVDNRNGTGSIYLTNFDHYMTLGDDSDVLARLGRELCFDDELKKGGYNGGPTIAGMGRVEDRNLMLLFQIPEGVAEKLAQIQTGDPITSVEALGRRYKR